MLRFYVELFATQHVDEKQFISAKSFGILTTTGSHTLKARERQKKTPQTTSFLCVFCVYGVPHATNDLGAKPLRPESTDNG